MIIALDYPYGYCEVGQRFYALKPGKRTERVSWIAALREDSIFAPMTFAGSCTRNLVEMWLENCLIPQLQPGDVIVIDNASFHHSQTIEEIVAEAGCEIWYLPPYSPGQTHLNSPENIHSVFNFALSYTQTAYSQQAITY